MKMPERRPLMRKTHLGKSWAAKGSTIKKHYNKYLSQHGRSRRNATLAMSHIATPTHCQTAHMCGEQMS